MISTDKFELDIIDLGANGCGVGKIDNFVYFVPFALPGEKVEVTAEKFEKHYAICKLLRVLEPSKHRIEPKCKYFGQCGGCSLQHMPSNQQKDYLNSQLCVLLKKNHFNILPRPCIGEAVYNYRNKVNFTIHDNSLCFAANNSKPIKVDNCPLFSCNLAPIIAIFNDYLKNVHNNFRALHIRMLDGSYQFTFVGENFEFPESKLLIDNLNKLSIPFSLHISSNPIANSSNITNATLSIYGQEKTPYVSYGIKSHISPAAFLQVNSDIQNKIYQDIASIVPLDVHIINGYGGTGILSAILAQKAKFVYSVEINKSASVDCEELFKENDISNALSICGDCKMEIPKLIRQDKNISHIIFDPPRKGIDKNILNVIKSAQIKNIIYLSCNPSSLINDLKILSTDYEIEFIQPYNMFPHTNHVETLVYLKLKNNQSVSLKT